MLYTEEAIAARRQMLQAAQEMLSGQTSFLEGTLRILRQRLASGLPDHPLIMTFVLIESETDHLPIDQVQDLWESEALSRLRPELESSEAWAQEVGREDCEALVAYLTSLA